jgi:anthranilate phosphoribosyltransferase
MKQTLTYLFAQNTLSMGEAKAILLRIGQGEFSDAEIASFLTVYLMRKITPQELAGFREALLELCIPLNFSEYNTIDVCGTGGDEKNTFNISTAAAFVIAGAGYKVVKHGNYGVSSSCGSSNVLEYLGYKFSNNTDKIKHELEQAGICYLHAPFFHPAMKHVGPVRKSLKIRTFFNLLGPMVNPSRPKNQIVGVFNQEVQELYHQVYKELDMNYYILHNLDGYDEISLTDKFRAVSQQEDKLYSPADLGFEQAKQEDLFGGETVKESADIFINVLSGKGTTAQTNVVLANAAFAIKCFNSKMNLDECVSIAREAISNGKAIEALKQLIELQNE